MFKSRLLSLISVLTITLVSSANAATHIHKKGDRVPGELIVKMRDGRLGLMQAQALVTSRLQRAFGEQAIESIKPFQTDAQLFVVKMAQKEAAGKAIKLLAAGDESIEYAEPNYLYYALTAGEPNDADFTKLWGLNNVGQADSSGAAGRVGSDINVMPLWAQGLTGSKNIVVAVIDTGVDWNHPDLAANIYTNPGETAGNGKDDDGNGFIDDVHGWNFSGKNGNSIDDNDHGSHCSGTIGGVGNNGKGVAGVNWNVSILPVKFLSASGSGSTADAVDSINYATKMKVNVMSNSWGGGGASTPMQTAIENANKAGILFIAAAGNETNDNDSSPTYPAGYAVPNVVSVAAVDNQDKLAGFSNWGATKVHVAAPGVRVYSTTKGGGYDSFSGTSMATPHVAGAAALIMASNPQLTAAEVKERLIRTSDPLRNLKKKSISKGRINVYNAVNNIVPPSTEPDESQWQNQAYALESEHPYKDSQVKTYEIKHPGAKFVRVHFSKFNTEARYDIVSIENQAGQSFEDLHGDLTNGFYSEYVEGDTLIIRFKSDSSVNAFGFSVDHIQVIQ